MKECIKYVIYVIKMNLKVYFRRTQYVNAQIYGYKIGDKVKLIKFLNHKSNRVPDFLVKNSKGNYDCIHPVFLQSK